RVSAAIVGAIVVLAALAVSVLWVVQGDRVLPNTSIAGIDVSGQTAPEVAEAIAPMVAERSSEPVTFAFEDAEYRAEPRELGLSIDVEATVAAALSRGREGLPGDVVTRLAAFRTDADVALVEEVDEAALEGWVEELAEELDRPQIDGGVTIDAADATVDAQRSQGGVSVDQTATSELALEAILTPGPERFDLPATTTPKRLSDEVVDTTAAQAEQALAEPLLLRSDDASLELTPRDLARVLEVEERGSTPGQIELALTVTPERLEREIGDLARERFDVEPTRASYRTDRTPPVTFDAQLDATFRPVDASVEVVPSEQGWAFDAELAAEQLTEVVRAGVREVELRREEVDGEFPTERADQLRPTHLLGTFTTYYQAGLARNRNIQLLADVIDGAVVLPGEQFSIDAIAGPRSCDQGYVPGGTIVRGELVDTCGGGISQFGTTTLNAAFFSGVQLDEWKAHSWYISRYPPGREATLYYPILDVKFTNNTDAAVLVKTAHTSTSVTVSLYGVPRASAVSARHGPRVRPTEFETEIRETDELPRGTERVLQPGQGGFTITVERIVELVGGGNDDRTITTVYTPQTRIIERGTDESGSDEDGEDGADRETEEDGGEAEDGAEEDAADEDGADEDGDT
ncbi:MAG: VanW family protein, partial [Nitriliruptoraceae bacterium]